MTPQELAELRRTDRLRDLARLGLEGDEDRPELRQAVQDLAAEWQVPVALATVMLDTAQLFAAASWLPPWVTEVGGMPVEWTFCRAMLATREGFAVSDLTRDPRFAGNPLVRLDGVRSYAGAPLISHRGHLVGTLCVLDVQVRDFDDATVAALAQRADDVMIGIERAASQVHQGAGR